MPARVHYSCSPRKLVSTYPVAAVLETYANLLVMNSVRQRYLRAESQVNISMAQRPMLSLPGSVPW